MDLVFKHFSNVIAMDRPTIVVICVLCALAAYFMKEYLANPPMVIFVYPVLVFLSILTQYLFTVFEVFPANKLDQWLMWTIMASICGTIIGICLVTGLVILREGSGDESQKSGKD
jgi:hypothetical protein